MYYREKKRTMIHTIGKRNVPGFTSPIIKKAPYRSTHNHSAVNHNHIYQVIKSHDSKINLTIINYHKHVANLP